MNKPMPQSTSNEMPVDLIHAFLSNQAKELEIKAQELEVAKQHDVHSFEVTKLSIKHQADDRESERKHHAALWKTWAKLGVCGSLLLTVVLCLAFWLGKEQFVLEIFRIAFYGGFGAVAGGYYQKSKLFTQRKEVDE